MDNLLFYALLALLLWYFLYYLPSQKKTSPASPRPTFQHQSTQTNPEIIETEPGPSHIECPGPTLPSEDQKELENTLDQVIKSMKDFSKELD